MLLFLVQKKLSNLDKDVLFNLSVALQMFTRRIVILHRVEDLKLRVESYQKKLNITKLEIYRYRCSFPRSSQNQRDLPRDIPLVIIEVLRFPEVDERQLALDEEASREVFAEVKVIIEKERIEIEQNGRIYQDWDDLRSDDFRNDPDITTPLNFLTISELEATDEAHDVYFNNMDSITTAT
ncbi:hypothetical protein Tco_1412896 [Tanacetum coccineum]